MVHTGNPAYLFSYKKAPQYTSVYVYCVKGNTVFIHFA